MEALKLARIFIVVCITSEVQSLTDAEIKAFTTRTHAERNTYVQGTVSVTVMDGDPTTLTLTSNGVPDHHTAEFPGKGPNPLRIQRNSWKIPRYPTNGTDTTCLPQGPIAMAINGVAMFNPYTRTCCDAGAEELDLFDDCYGHPSPTGTYHYHLSPKCLHKIICNKASTILGVAFDGYPIYGPIDEDGRQLTKKDLDVCSGKVTNGQYRYHITNEFPYIMGCYRGKLHPNAGVRITRGCQCRTPTVPCLEFRNRRPRRAADKPFPCETEDGASEGEMTVNQPDTPTSQTTSTTGQSPPDQNTVNTNQPGGEARAQRPPPPHRRRPFPPPHQRPRGSGPPPPSPQPHHPPRGFGPPPRPPPIELQPIWFG